MTNTSYLHKEKITFRDYIILGCLYFAAYASMASDFLNSLALYIALPVAFMLCLFSTRKLFTNKYLALLSALFIWETLSYIWAYYPDMTIRELHRVMGAFLISYIMSVYGSRQKLLIWVYLVYIVLYFSAWYYASNNLLVVTDYSENERLNDAKLNANTMAYYTFYVSFIIYIIPEFIQSIGLSKVFKLLFLAMIPLSFFVALSTASRQVLIIQIPLLIVLLWLRYYNGKKKKKFPFLFITTILIVVLAPKAYDIFENSFLAERVSYSLAEDSRTTLLKESIQVGLDHFPLGVGAGNYIMFAKSRHISHNSFTELFANVGVVGVLIYTILLCSFLFKQWKNYKISKNRLNLNFCVFAVFYLIDQVFYVFYVDPWLISFFILVATHSLLYSNYQKY